MPSCQGDSESGDTGGQDRDTTPPADTSVVATSLDTLMSTTEGPTGSWESDINPTFPPFLPRNHRKVNPTPKWSHFRST